MLGKITNPETIESNKKWTAEMIEKAGAKGIEFASPEVINAGDVILHRERDGWVIKTVAENDIKIEFGFKKVFGRSFTNFQRFVF